MFGVPSGVIWEPTATGEEILAGYVLAPLDPATWPPDGAAMRRRRDRGPVLAPDAEAPVVLVDEALAVAGRGLEGDRYAAGQGTFASGRPGSALTLVDAAVLDTFDHAVDHRRNVVMRGTDLNALVGREFMLGEVAAAAAACANRAPTSIASTAAASCDRSCTGRTARRHHLGDGTCASATGSRPRERLITRSTSSLPAGRVDQRVERTTTAYLRIRRSARIGALVAGQGARAAGGRITDRGRDDERRREAQSRRYAKIAEEVVEQLGRMKGAAMKFGQVLRRSTSPTSSPRTASGSRRARGAARPGAAGGVQGRRARRCARTGPSRRRAAPALDPRPSRRPPSARSTAA